jgi:hypothetical protein
VDRRHKRLAHRVGKARALSFSKECPSLLACESKVFCSWRVSARCRGQQERAPLPASRGMRLAWRRVLSPRRRAASVAVAVGTVISLASLLNFLAPFFQGALSRSTCFRSNALCFSHVNRRPISCSWFSLGLTTLHSGFDRSRFASLCRSFQIVRGPKRGKFIAKSYRRSLGFLLQGFSSQSSSCKLWSKSMMGL